MSKRDLIPDTFEGKLREARDHLTFIAAGRPMGLSDTSIQTRLAVAIEDLMYMLYEVGGDVTEFVEGVIYEMFEGEDEGECDDVCDICMSSGVCIEFTTRDGRTVCTDCAENFEEEEDDEDQE